jgi:threonine synthase
MAAGAIKISKGAALAVSDTEILEAQKIISSESGILVEPSCAASYAGYLKFFKSNNISSKTIVMLMLTGNGLKDTSAMLKWNSKPEIYSFDQLRKLFRIK